MVGLHHRHYHRHHHHHLTEHECLRRYSVDLMSMNAHICRYSTVERDFDELTLSFEQLDVRVLLIDRDTRNLTDSAI